MKAKSDLYKIAFKNGSSIIAQPLESKAVRGFSTALEPEIFMSTTQVNIHEYPEDPSLLPQYRVAVMQAALEGKPVEVQIYPTGAWSPSEPKWDWISYSYRIAPPKFASGHNPDNLTEDQIGVKDGYRTLSVEEHEALVPKIEISDGLEHWNRGHWCDRSVGGVLDITYRTKHPIGHFLPKTPPKVTRYFRPKGGLFEGTVHNSLYWIEIFPNGVSRFAYLDGEYRGDAGWSLTECEAKTASGDWVEFDGNVEPFRPKPAPAHWTDKLPKEYADLAKKRRAEFVAKKMKGYSRDTWNDSNIRCSFPWLCTPEDEFWSHVDDFLYGRRTVLPPIHSAPKVKKLIPWTLETVPFPVLLRQKTGTQGTLILPGWADCEGLNTGYSIFSWKRLLKDFEYSLDHTNRTWLPCGTEVDDE